MTTQRKEVLLMVKSLRESRHLSQEMMAEYMGLSQAAYARFEIGKSKTDLHTLEKFCNVMKMTLKELFTGTDNGNHGVDKEDVKAILTVELKKEKKDQILRLVFGDNNIEILNK